MGKHANLASFDSVINVLEVQKFISDVGLMRFVDRNFDRLIYKYKSYKSTYGYLVNQKSLSLIVRIVFVTEVYDRYLVGPRIYYKYWAGHFYE